METVDKDCKHKDCVYRSRLSSGGNTCYFCDYIGVTGKPRGCGIADCDKYRKGKKKFKIDIYSQQFTYRIEDDE